MHAWKNTTDKYCRFLTVIVPSEKYVFKSSGESLEVTKLPGLTD
jgi:hypothetical protein